MTTAKRHSKEIDMIYGKYRPSQNKINESAKWARDNGVIPRGCIISCDQVYGGWVVYAEYTGDNERTRSKYFDI